MNTATTAFIIHLCIMIIFGALGGWVNFLREQKDSVLNTKTKENFRLSILMGLLHPDKIFGIRNDMKVIL